MYYSQHAYELLNRLKSSFEVVSLSEVLYNHFKPPIFKRLWVDDERYGTLFISGNDIVRNAPEDPRYVSSRIPRFDDFLLSKGWVIFQSAGQISGIFGQPIYVSGWMDGAFCADDVYRLIPNSVADGGYLFAFLSTEAGKLLIKRQASGNSIPRLWEPHVNDISVPWPDEYFRTEIGHLVSKAHDKRDWAYLAAL